MSKVLFACSQCVATRKFPRWYLWRGWALKCLQCGGVMLQPEKTDTEEVIEVLKPFPGRDITLYFIVDEAEYGPSLRYWTTWAYNHRHEDSPSEPENTIGYVKCRPNGTYYVEVKP